MQNYFECISHIFLQIVNFTGSTLVEGRDDGKLITLHRDIR